MSNGGGLHAAVREQRGKAVPDSGEEPYEIDVTTPSVARMYDYYLGGKDNYAADREAARLVLGAAPDVPLAALVIFSSRVSQCGDLRRPIVDSVADGTPAV